MVTWDTVRATDNSGSVTLTSNHEPGSAFQIGENIVVYTATDQSGNSATSTFVVIVECIFVELIVELLAFYIYCNRKLFCLTSKQLNYAQCGLISSQHKVSLSIDITIRGLNSNPVFTI